jgi:hypothetical protein
MKSIGNYFQFVDLRSKLVDILVEFPAVFGLLISKVLVIVNKLAPGK